MEPVPRYRHASAGIGQMLYAWGGSGPTAKVGTTKIESFDLAVETWKKPQQLRGSLPDGLRGMAVTTDGENAYFFGGSTDSSKNLVYYNTLYQVNLSTLQCNELVPGASSQAPQKKSNSAIVYFDQKLVVHGGCTAGGELTEELHVFDLKTSVWSVQSTTGAEPFPMASHSFTKIDHNRAVVFGGRAYRLGKINDTYILDLKRWHWTKLKDSGPRPPARNSHTTCCVAGPLTGQQHPVVAVIGGNTGDPVGDVWLLDVDNGMWSKVTLSVAITPRDGHSATVFGCGSSFRTIVLFGGYGKSGHLSDTTLLLLELRGGSWQVTEVVKSDELGKSQERLGEQMKKLELSSPQNVNVSEQQKQSTAANGAASLIKGTSSPTDTRGANIEIINIEEVRMGKRLGQGAFGAVFEAKWKTKTVAVKVCLGNLLESLSREIQILSSLPPHPNVISFFGVALSSDCINTYIITELAPNGSLFNYLHVKGKKPSPDQSFAWALQVASGMQHLHKNDVVHRDLKSGNILLSFGLFAKVCDFGTARTLPKTAMTTQKGTFRWMAPEIVEGVEANINKMCDVFSYGMVVYEIFAYKIPYDDIPSDPLVGLAVLQGKRPPLPATLPPFLHPLVEACWKKETGQRPQFEAIVMAIQTGSFEV